MAVAPPPPSTSQDVLDTLVREARARQQRRRLFGVALVALATAIALSSYAVVSGGGTGAKHSRGRAPHSVGATARCRSDQVRLAGPQENGSSTGHFVENFVFTNESTQSCMLRGWPTVAALVPGRVALETSWKHSRIRNRAPGTNHPLAVHTVRLRPHASASFNVVAAYPFMLRHFAHCIRSSGELVTPPGGGAPLRAEHRGNTKYCVVPLLVTPVVAGRIDHYRAAS
jgi:hypothetical protein